MIGLADLAHAGLVTLMCLGLDTAVWMLDCKEAALQARAESAIASVQTVPPAPEPMFELTSEPVFEPTPESVPTPDVPLTRAEMSALLAACEAGNVPQEIALGLIQVESNFNRDTVSSCGCYGLCQLNPRYFPSGLSPAENIKAGVGYLADCLRRCGGDMGAALTAYNAGHDTGNRKYAQRVIQAAQRYR